MKIYILYNLALLIYFFYIFLISKRYLHMLQLNSYINSRYINWFKGSYIKENNIKNILPILAILFILKNLIVFIIIWLFVYLFLFIQISKIPEKKKFVVTNRVKRLYITLISQFLIISVLANYLFTFNNQLLTLFFFGFLVFIGESKILYILLANRLNLPMENLINKWYYNDAKRILNKNNGLIIIGVTGSYGKTSSKYILNRLLLEKYNVLMTPESFNTLMGVIRTIREYLNPTHEVFIVEMGAKKRGDIKEICELVQPQYALLTSIGLQHLETFKSLENIIKTKYELIDSLSQTGVAFLNYENKNIRDKQGNKNSFSYGIENPNLAYWAESIFYDKSGSSFTLCSYNGERINLKTDLLGMHNVLNIIGACAIALELGIKKENIQYAVKQLKPVPHRLELKGAAGEFMIIDDAFNSNPEGANEALNILNKFESNLKILITPGMVELGKSEYECNFNFGKKAATICDYIIVVGNNNSKSILDGLKSENYSSEKVYVAKNLKEALKKLDIIKVQDCVVLFENDLPDNYEDQ